MHSTTGGPLLAVFQPGAEVPPFDRVYDLHEVRRFFFRVAKSTLYKNVREGHFPAPIRIGVKRVGWRESDIKAWMAAQQQQKAA